MKIHAKPKKTVQRGLRPSSSSSALVEFPPTITEKMGKILERALDNNREISEKERFVIAHAYKVARFRQLRDFGKEKDDLFRKISKSEAEGLRIGFNVLEVRGINYFILQKDKEGQLESFFQKLEIKAGVK